uniref:zinc finger domain-containing protein n=1 Tax=Paracoccus sp. TRP TaxID=412597 RepID=UPI000225F555|nr:hypothetical protein [Paracoccus sp. TRP]
MPDFTAFRHPALAVPCPVCRARVGIWCGNSIGLPSAELHTARGIEAERAFIDQHGPDAAIIRAATGWQIDRCGLIRD